MLLKVCESVIRNYPLSAIRYPLSPHCGPAIVALPFRTRRTAVPHSSHLSHLSHCRSQAKIAASSLAFKVEVLSLDAP